MRWQAALCTDCDRCIDGCPRHASPKTSQISVAEVLALLRRYGPLLTGITVSGGEATTQLPFVIALFTAIRQAQDLSHLTCLLDSNGSLAETGWQRLLASLRLLASHGKLAELRLLHVPGRSDFLDADGKLETGLASFLQNLGPVPIRLNGFRQHGVRGVATSWPEAGRDELTRLARAVSDRGLGPVSLPAII
ncbi:pyruvate formate lyase-activating protein [Aeromonas salmonicida subsp. salmonicida]|uniref:Pyruvate formate lyase activating enzyme n=1 Tax=Aeromonas salmonicida subsp. salmonicida 01-B526 TaxID=1076135 RepID=A0ABN0E1B2_AERSS|nr:pyruvate formate lyase-activating protein [Aeromonas salmonicida subsp. salmonicida 01-B526]EHI52988.1 pyruvate formate lyase activating enzyme [Aeromonas salmonicida subsp. salmonicida 01-B526]QEO85287.1 pyruvate formate lyase-activating protein [Aeromonas salmonicida subsp. salmonicida]QHU95105.1 pyruvate formate lyase-activating protein [Aeromonas salmonicida subsp. salmonicida]